ncbi:MAG: ATP-binding cassette domain-containing protein [Puniceicoccales bacterium]|jgi:ABC-type lipoprotein export system ATPase subunit|nr:ATP-binding cassette domain-containing protein [Puniceicoccales bacterium]
MLLSADKLTKFFVSSKTERFCLWHDVNFELFEGESMAICGESGSGKSTLLFALGGLESVDSGTICFCNQMISHHLNPHIPGISYIFQHYYLIEELNVLENLLLPVRVMGEKVDTGVMNRAHHLLLELGLEKFSYQLPRTLSGGERQRVAIGRAFMMNPRLILADEPTGSLDEQTSLRVSQMFFSICQKFTTSFILVTHNENFARQTNKYCRLEQGELKRCK